MSGQRRCADGYMKRSVVLPPFKAGTNNLIAQASAAHEHEALIELLNLLYGNSSHCHHVLPHFMKRLQAPARGEGQAQRHRHHR